MSFFPVGQPVPYFKCPTPSNPTYDFSTVAGRYVAISFLGSLGPGAHAAFIDRIKAMTDIFDDQRASFFYVSIDQQDQALNRTQQQVPGFRIFWDFNARISQGYKAFYPQEGSPGRLEPVTYILDYGLRVLQAIPFAGDADAHAAAVASFMRSLPDIGALGASAPFAPVLLVPNIISRDDCRRLIEYYDQTGGEESGFMRTNAEGKTIGMVDHSHKRRSDCQIADEELRKILVDGIDRRLAPQIFRAFQFRATRIERYIVACYDAGQGGYFRPHRDNTTKGTAHRRFAVTINLNAEDYEGGELRFPEFGPRTYRASTGSAVVFSCSLLHEALPVTKGRRYCTLPFLYDEGGAKIREANLDALADETLRESVRASIMPASARQAVTP